MRHCAYNNWEMDYEKSLTMLNYGRISNGNDDSNVISHNSLLDSYS